MARKLVTYSVRFCRNCVWMVEYETSKGKRFCGCCKVEPDEVRRNINNVLAIPDWCPLPDANEDEPTQS